VKRKLKGLNHIFHIKVRKKWEFGNEWKRYKISSIGREEKADKISSPCLLNLTLEERKTIGKLMWPLGYSAAIYRKKLTYILKVIESHRRMTSRPVSKHRISCTLNISRRPAILAMTFRSFPHTLHTKYPRVGVSIPRGGKISSSFPRIPLWHRSPLSFVFNTYRWHFQRKSDRSVKWTTHPI